MSRGSAVAPHHRPVVVLRLENRERREMRGQPRRVVRAHLLGGAENANPAVLIGGPQLHVVNLAQAGDQVIDLASARQPVERHGPLEQTDRDPGLAPRRILSGLEVVSR